MQYLFLQAAACRGLELEHRTAAAATAPSAVSAGRCAVEIAGGVENQAGGIGPAGVAKVERVQHFFRPRTACRRHQLEHCSRVIGATIVCCAVEVAVRIEDKAS